MNGDRPSADEPTTRVSRPSSVPRDEAPGDDSRVAPAGKDNWDKISILARPLGALLTAVVVAGLGFLAQSALEERQKTIREIAVVEQKEQSKSASRALEEQSRLATADQNHRLYTELLSRREESANQLRMNMFNTIVGEVFKSPAPLAHSGAQADELLRNLSDRLLKLEMLALNFAESLSLRPLFVVLDNQIESMDKDWGAHWKIWRSRYRTRLRSLARRVSASQVSALATGGVTFEFQVPIKSLENGKVFKWPRDSANRDVREKDLKLRHEAITQYVRHTSEKDLDGVRRKYSVQFSRPKTDRQTVDVKLEIRELENQDIRPVVMQFKLNYYNFPMVDNTRLSFDQRFALVMQDFDPESSQSITVVGICFPGLYAGQKDKPFLDQVIERLSKDRPKSDEPLPAKESSM